MQPLPKLDEPSRDVLRALHERGVIPGADLMGMARLETPKQLVDAVKPLLSAGLIGASGNTSDERDILYAYFNIRPSVIPLIRYVLSQPA